MAESMAGGFIQNMLALMQLRQQQEQFLATNQLNRQNSQANLLQLLAQVGQGFDDRGAALDFFNSAGGQFDLAPDALLALARGQAPTEAAIRGGAARRGRESISPERATAQDAEAASVVSTGMNQSQGALSTFLQEQLGRLGAGGSNAPVANMLGEAAVLRLLAGMSPGQFSMDQATHNLQPEQLNQAAEISAGLSLSAPQIAANSLTARGQDLGYASSMAGNRLGWASLAQQGELGYLNLAMQGQVALAQSTGKNGLTIQDIPELVAIQNTLTENLAKAQTPAARQQFMSGLGTVNSLLNGLGVPTPQVNPTQDVNQFNPMRILQPSTWGNRTTLPMYQPPTTLQMQGAQNFLNPAAPFNFGFP